MKLYMKEIATDVKMNKHSIGKITHTVAMKTLLESCNEDKCTLGNISSSLNGSKIGSISSSISEKTTNIDDRISRSCLDMFLI